MAHEAEGAADVLTGAVVAGAVDAAATVAAPRNPPPPAAPSAAQPAAAARAACLNCGAAVTGRYCAACGQSTHVHRSLASLGHDLLHAVFHFEGKFWRTMPELAIHPGRLTRRYVDGERAKFISPMALYLFSVFLMYGVFSLTGVAPQVDERTGVAAFQAGNRVAAEAIVETIDNLRSELGQAGLPAERRAQIEAEIAKLEASREVMLGVAAADWERVEEAAAQLAPPEADAAPAAPAEPSTFATHLQRGIDAFRENPRLVSYRVQTYGYKYSWLLVPLSMPFMWLLFIGRRDLRIYDHAVFVTYSISFMMLLFVLAALARAANVPSDFVETALQVVPPVHMYRQLRGAYGLSRWAAVGKLLLLLISAAIVLTVFVAVLVFFGVLG